MSTVPYILLKFSESSKTELLFLILLFHKKHAISFHPIFPVNPQANEPMNVLTQVNAIYWSSTLTTDQQSEFLVIYRVIQKSGQTLKMNNSKTNKDKKMRFIPNREKRSLILCDNQKKRKKIFLLATKGGTVGFLI